jgi:hypothetical protein
LSFLSRKVLQSAVAIGTSNPQLGGEIGLHTGHNTLRRHLHLMGMTNIPLCRRSGA